MNWQTWIAKKLDIQARMDKQKIIEYNTIIRDLKIKLTGVERELQVRKTGFIPTLCNTCMHQYAPKPPSEPIGTYEKPEPQTDPMRAPRYIERIRTQHEMPKTPRHLRFHKITLH